MLRLITMAILLGAMLISSAKEKQLVHVRVLGVLGQSNIVEVVNRAELMLMVKAEKHPLRMEYTIGCDASNCGDLTAGDEFSGEVAGKTMWIIAPSQRKPIRIKYKILNIRPLR
jgi:hypothetical protein